MTYLPKSVRRGQGAVKGAMGLLRRQVQLPDKSGQLLSGVLKCRAGASVLRLGQDNSAVSARSGHQSVPRQNLIDLGYGAIGYPEVGCQMPDCRQLGASGKPARNNQ